MHGRIMTSYYSAIMRDGPIAYYRLDEASGTIVHDSSGNGDNATISGGVTLGAGGLIASRDTAMQFDGSTGYIYTSSPISLGDASFEVWINPTTLTDDASAVSRRIIINNIDGTHVYQLTLASSTDIGLSNNGFVFAVNDSTGQVIVSGGSAAYISGQVYHLVGTYSLSTRIVRLYVNGQSISNGGATGWGIGTVGLNIGRRTDSSGYFSGIIDEPAIYNYVLTQDQIVHHYHAGLDAGILRLRG